jgi:hypothetical protein
VIKFASFVPLQNNCKNCPSSRGCRMVYFLTKNLDKFWRALEWKLLVYFMGIWNIFYEHRRHLMTSKYILFSFGIFSTVLVYCLKKNLATLHRAMLLWSQRPLHVQGDAGHPSWQGGGQEKHNWKKWRVKEEEKHKRPLSKKLSKKFEII